MNHPLDMSTMSPQECLEKISAMPKIDLNEENESDKVNSEACKNNKFNISEILENDHKPMLQSSPSASSEGSSHESDQPPPMNLMFDPRLALPFAAMLQQSIFQANAQAGSMIGSIPMMPMMGFPHAQQFMAHHLKSMNNPDFTNRVDTRDEKEEKGDVKCEEARDSTGGSPLESDVEDDDDMARGSDDDANSSDPTLARKKKTRTVFSRSQVSQLEMTFEMKRYLSSQERSHLAQKLHLTETQVKIWFQNRRNKFKRQAQSDDPNVSLQLHRANMFSVPQPSSLPAPLMNIPPTSSPLGMRPVLPSPLDASAAARFLFGYSSLAGNTQNMM